MKRVRIVIGVDAAVTVQTEGFSGAGCKAITQAVEAALGKVTHEEKTEEFYRHEQANTSIKSRL